MSRNLLAPVLAAFFLATAAFAGPKDMVSAIDVSIDLPAISNPAAATRYTTIADDLKAAIATRLVDRMADEGVKISVDLSEVELSNSFTEIVGTANTRLVGSVHITDAKDNSNFKAFDLTVDINQAKVFFPTTIDVTKISDSSDDFYAAMIAAFADGVVTNLNG